MIFLQLPTAGLENITLVYSQHQITFSYQLCFKSTNIGVVTIERSSPPWNKRKLFTVKQIKYPK